MKLEYPPGATPIDADELEQLIPTILLQSELNQFEEANIRDAVVWAQKARLKQKLLTGDGLKLVHERMFGEVWKWAGKYRTTERNIGCAPYQIAEEIHKLCADTRLQIAQNVSNWNAFAVKFHHRLVAIHPFPNGNGRHARLCADILLRHNKLKPLSWGRSDLRDPDETRAEYLRCLRTADKGDTEPLVRFATRR